MVAKNKNMVTRLVMIITSVLFLLHIPGILSGQADKKYIRQGNRDYGKDKFQDAEILYRKAIDDNKRSPDAVFNIGDALYKQNKYEEAARQFSDNVNMIDDSEKKAAGLYNMGNSFLQAGKLKESIEAYKGSLKLQPDNLETKYNLAYAQDRLRKQEEQKQNQQDQNQENKDNQDQKNDQDKQKDNQQNKDQKQDQQQKKQDQQQQQQEQTISKEDAQRLLNSLANDEKNVQEKVKLAKASRERKLTVKNW